MPRYERDMIPITEKTEWITVKEAQEIYHLAKDSMYACARKSGALRRVSPKVLMIDYALLKEYMDSLAE